jgi:N-acyl-D-amino-acid deacylase
MDLALRGDRIAATGNLAGAEARRVIDAEGLCVCPGFIDVHSHSDAYLLLEPSAASKLFQGITTEVCGNCGSSAAPLLGRYRMPSDWLDQPYPGTWKTVAEYRTLYDRVRPAVNVRLLTGHNALHAGICGYDPRGADPDELRRMKKALEQALEEGSGGLSTGLIYPPGSAVPAEEIIELARVVARHGGIYTSHMRSETRALREAVDETLEILRRSGVRGQISHLKTGNPAAWPMLDEVLETVEAARADGLAVCADRYPYTAGCTDLDIVLPEWASYGGREAILQRLRDPDTRRRIREALLQARGEADWGHVMIGSTAHPDNARFKGVYLTEAARQLKLGPVDALLQIIDLDDLKTGGIFFGMSEENMWRILEQPWVMPGTDASLRAPQGRLSRDHPHPRAYGSFTKLLKAAFDGHTVPPEAMIHKMTGQAAAHFRIPDRGRLKEGGFADMLIFDPARLRTESSYADPHRLSEGMEYIFVNGRAVLEKRKLNPPFSGRFLDSL